MKKTEKIVLIGGGGHCTSVIDVIEQQGLFNIVGIIDQKSKIGSTNLGYQIIGSDEDLPTLAKEYSNFFITIGQLGEPKRRKEIFLLLQKMRVNIPFIVSPKSYVSNHAIIGRGTIVMHMAQINANANIGNNCIINSHSLIEHDALISDHCHIATGAIINGGTSIGESTFIGSGAICIQGTKVPAGSFIKANSLFK